MDIYYIYSNKKSVEPVKSGFSFPAAAFGVFWLIYKRAWLVLGIYAVFTIALSIISYLIGYEIGDAAYFVYSIALGAFATEIIEYSLRSRNYKFQDSVIARSELEAKMKFLSRSGL